MRFAGIVTLLYSVSVVVSGWIAYVQHDSPFFVGLSVVAAVALVAGAVGIWRRRLPAAFVSCAVAMLLGLFFGYLFISSETFLPGGMMLISSFVTLFVILIALFATLAQQE